MKLPGNVSIVWALIYMLVGMYGIPLLLSFFMRGKKSDAK